MATDDAYATPEDTPLVEAAPGVLANDSSDEGTLCVTAFDASSLDGSLGDGPAEDGSFTFTPPANFNGETSFSYDVGLLVDGTCGDAVGEPATVTITVDAVNDAPSAAADSFTAVANRTLNIGPPGVLRNDSDLDGDTVTAVKVENPAHGVVTLAPDGGFSYTPATGFVGGDQFAYRASDGTALSEKVVVSLTVAAIPTPVPTAVPTPVPTATPELTEEPSASPSLEPSASTEASASPSAAPSSSPTASPLPGDPTTSAGGLSIPVIVVGLMLLSLVAFGAAVYVPKWLERQRAGELIEDDGYLDDEYPEDDDSGQR
jgi:hypothetical protein